jgi:hypothetical protein
VVKNIVVKNIVVKNIAANQLHPLASIAER